VNTYHATLELDPRSGQWMADIEGLPVHTWGRSLGRVKEYAHEALAVHLDVAALDVQGRIVFRTPPLPEPVLDALDNAERARAEADSAAERAAEARAAEARAAAAGALVQDAHLSMRDAAEILGISHQRVQQLLSPTPLASRPPVERGRPHGEQRAEDALRQVPDPERSQVNRLRRPVLEIDSPIAGSWASWRVNHDGQVLVAPLVVGDLVDPDAAQPARRSTWPSISAWMRVTMPPTARHPTPSSSVIAVFDVAVANQPTVSSKSRVNDEACRAHGTAAATTPCSAQRTRTILASRYTRMVPRSRLRHRRGPALEDFGMLPFDAWAANFGCTVTAVELSPDGSSYRLQTRFARFENVPELLTMYRRVADVRTNEDLDMALPALAGARPAPWWSPPRRAAGAPQAQGCPPPRRPLHARGSVGWLPPIGGGRR
jgi:hypothetical protein